jgi:hypothetical protein
MTSKTFNNLSKTLFNTNKYNNNNLHIIIYYNKKIIKKLTTKLISNFLINNLIYNKSSYNKNSYNNKKKKKSLCCNSKLYKNKILSSQNKFKKKIMK